MRADELQALHAQLSHYARQHQDVQQLRIGVSNRVFAMRDEGIEDVWVAPIEAQLDALAGLEQNIDRQLNALMRRHPMAPWIEAEARGLSLRTFALLFGITGPLDRFANVAKLRAYLGQHVVDGMKPKRKRGEKLNWSPDGERLCYVISDGLVRNGAGGPYREAYDRKKAEYFARPRFGESGCPMGQVHRAKTGAVLACVKAGDTGETSAHLHNAAKRYAVKELLKDLWRAWRDLVVVEEEVPVA